MDTRAATDVSEELDAKLCKAGFYFHLHSWGRSVWRHPDYKGNFWAEEAEAAIPEIEAAKR